MQKRSEKRVRRTNILDEARAEGRPLTVAEFKKLTAPKGETEHAQQARLARWVRENVATFPDLRNFTAVPHAEQSKRQAALKWEEGVMAGYPDCLLDVARGGWFGLRIEIKRESEFEHAHGEPRPVQAAWHQRLAAEGYLVGVSWGWEPARDLTLWYMRQPKTLAGLTHLCELPMIPRLRLVP